MSSIFEDIQRGKMRGGKLYLKHENKETIKHELAEHKVPQYKVTPYYDGGMHLETYGESHLRGFGRHIKRKAPLVAREIIAVGKKTVVPAIKDTNKAIGQAFLKHGKAQFEDLRKRKARGINVWW